MKVTNFISVRNLIKSGTAFLALSLFILPIHSADYETGSPAVTATVPAPSPSPTSTSPNSPILISPDNNTIINSSSPTFIFEPSTDASGINKYELWIDGGFDQNVSHLTASTISTPATNALIDGLHTWKIKAVNNNGLGTDSATFSFTIDTTPPVILINQVAEHPVTLSSQDQSTIPAGYSLSTTDLTPTFSGTLEAYATLTLSLTGSVASYTLNTTADANSTFSLTPTFQLASDTYTVYISSSDQASNSSSLPSFTLNITSAPAKTPAITIPLPSPLPTITIPGLPIPQPKLPTLPQALTAFPLSIESSSFLSLLPWLIIFLFILYIFINKYIILYLILIIFAYLTLATLHWLPILFTLLHLYLLLYLKKHSSWQPDCIVLSCT